MFLFLLPEDEVLLEDLTELVALIVQHALVDVEILRKDRVAIARSVQSRMRPNQVLHILDAPINLIKLVEYARHQIMN